MRQPVAVRPDGSALLGESIFATVTGRPVMRDVGSATLQVESAVGADVSCGQAGVVKRQCSIQGAGNQRAGPNPPLAVLVLVRLTPNRSSGNLLCEQLGKFRLQQVARPRDRRRSSLARS